ncbi:MAG: hypothetical protein WC155_01390 [Candidatus Cloacimonadales bacterium]
MSKYTLSGSQEFDNLIDNQLKQIKEEILNLIPPCDIVAILLGGGYGRGEGGVFIKDGKEYPYNDYDLFVILKNVGIVKKKKYQKKMELIHEKFTPLFKIDVDVGPLQTVNAISKAPFWMMWYELRNGHIMLWGNILVKNYFPDYHDSKMPLMEAYRLMLNRGVGLLLCKKHFDTYEEQESQDFILRNIRKAQLAMGDAFLIKKHKFHYSYKQRNANFANLNSDEDLKKLGIEEHYRIAYSFKERPHSPQLSKKECYQEYKEVLALYEKVYNWLFVDTFEETLNVEKYQQKILNVFKDNENYQETIKNVYKNVKANYHNIIKDNAKYYHPRYRLFMTLPYFLFGKKSIDCANILNSVDGSQHEKLLESFIKIWENNN